MGACEMLCCERRILRREHGNGSSGGSSLCLTSTGLEALPPALMACKTSHHGMLRNDLPEGVLPVADDVLDQVSLSLNMTFSQLLG